MCWISTDHTIDMTTTILKWIPLKHSCHNHWSIAHRCHCCCICRRDPCPKLRVHWAIHKYHTDQCRKNDYSTYVSRMSRKLSGWYVVRRQAVLWKSTTKVVNTDVSRVREMQQANHYYGSARDHLDLHGVLQQCKNSRPCLPLLELVLNLLCVSVASYWPVVVLLASQSDTICDDQYATMRQAAFRLNQSGLNLIARSQVDKRRAKVKSLYVWLMILEN